MKEQILAALAAGPLGLHEIAALLNVPPERLANLRGCLHHLHHRGLLCRDGKRWALLPPLPPPVRLELPLLQCVECGESSFILNELDLCRGCASVPEVVEEHAEDVRSRGLPTPCRALPGTERKVATLEERQAAGLALWHDADAEAPTDGGIVGEIVLASLLASLPAPVWGKRSPRTPRRLCMEAVA